MSSDVLDVEDEKVYKTRLFYNSKVVPSKVDALLARKSQKCEVLGLNNVRSQDFSRTSELSLHTASQVRVVTPAQMLAIQYPKSHTMISATPVSTLSEAMQKSR